MLCLFFPNDLQKTIPIRASSHTRLITLITFHLFVLVQSFSESLIEMCYWQHTDAKPALSRVGSLFYSKLLKNR